MMSAYVLMFTLLLGGFAVLITGVDVDAILAQHKQSMQTLLNMANQRYSQQGQDECFNWYFEALDSNMNIYRNGTVQCNITAVDAIQSLNVQGADTRNSFQKSTRDVCGGFEWCNWEGDLLEFYNCYSNVSTNSTSIMYRLSANSSAEYNSLLIKYNIVDANKHNCDEKVREEYIENSAVTDKQFQACRAGNGVPI